ncbi:uncharacterized protein [Cherax quadricarinatus]|uniref:uncharacterized protein n=1 Tax=Cherax quadricarinatus TaxID=27406 RepID=UPI00387EB60E
MVKLGQRVTLLLSLPISLASWIILATAPTNWVVLLVRFFQGITMSSITNSSLTYVAELSHCKIRGRLMSTLDISRQMGILLAYALGSSKLTWRKVALTCGFVNTVIPFVCLLYLPNSPRWLATQGYMDRAHKSLLFFRGPNYDVNKEMQDIRDELEKTTNDGGSMMFVGALLGSLIVSVPMMKLGQRVTLLLSLPISLASWIILATAPTNWVVTLARFFQGITMSSISNSSSTYVAELSHSEIRGRPMSTLDLSR